MLKGRTDLPIIQMKLELGISDFQVNNVSESIPRNSPSLSRVFKVLDCLVEGCGHTFPTKKGQRFVALEI